jgi:hypothetical protein
MSGSQNGMVLTGMAVFDVVPMHEASGQLPSPASRSCPNTRPSVRSWRCGWSAGVWLWVPWLGLGVLFARGPHNTRANVDSLARYTPSSASMGTMRAGGTAQKRGSLATLSNSVRSSALKVWLGIARTTAGLPSPLVVPSCAFHRCRVRASIAIANQNAGF